MAGKGGNRAGVAVSMDRNWQAESDLDCLIRADEIQKDPKRFAAAQEVAKARLQSIVNVSSDKKE
jgi:hypothetical protein